ncbi:hypothetical protein T484DRAFT_2764812 [Baffinella frigidus]|nr:hypothetical protein T484DRAFT_2764812 [Cryptophyta sp. CCMP2293]
MDTTRPPRSARASITLSGSTTASSTSSSSRSRSSTRSMRSCSLPRASGQAGDPAATQPSASGGGWATIGRTPAPPSPNIPPVAWAAVAARGTAAEGSTSETVREVPEVVAVVGCRAALGAIISERNQAGEMGDAQEALGDILQALETCLSVSAGDGGNTITNTFGIDVKEERSCSQCGYVLPEEKHGDSNFFYHVLPVTLRTFQPPHPDTGVGPEHMLKQAYETDDRPCTKCSQGANNVNIRFDCKRTLARPPVVFSLAMNWETAEAPAADILATLARLPLVMDLNRVFAGLEKPTLYRLRSMWCWYGKHYVLIVYNPRIRQFVLFDDQSVKAIGGGWAAVENKCANGGLQPHVVFYELCPDQ